MAESPKPKAKPVQDVDVVIVRSYPKVIFFYPSMFAALICCFFAGKYPPGVEGSNGAAMLGGAFMIVFLFNLTVISFEFRTWVTLLIVMGLVSVALVVYVLNQSWNFLPDVLAFIRGIRVEMTWNFYAIYALALLIIYGVIWIILRFYYLEIKSNEVVYRHGLFGDVERHDTRGMKHTKEIGDLMEFALWRSGRLILAVQGRKEPHVLDNVPRINRVEHQIQQVTSRQSVEIET